MVTRKKKDMTEKIVIAALEKIGVTDQEKQAEFFRALKDSAIMDQELDADELDQVSGGDCSLSDQEADYYCCVKDHYRNAKKHGCAQSYNAYWSMCSNNDACTFWAVVYGCTSDYYD